MDVEKELWREIHKASEMLGSLGWTSNAAMNRYRGHSFGNLCGIKGDAAICGPPKCYRKPMTKGQALWWWHVITLWRLTGPPWGSSRTYTGTSH